MLRLGLALSLLLPASAYAQDRQYRELQLADGRSLRAEVLATEATGLRMRTPQGETLVSFELLVDIRPISEADFDSQPPMRIWVHSPDHLAAVASVYEAIPNVQVSTASSAGGLAPGVVVQLDGCGADFGCMAGAVDEDAWMWLVTALPPTDDNDAALILRARATGGPPITREDVDVYAAEPLWEAGHEVIGLRADGGAPKSVKEQFATSDTRPTGRDKKGGNKKLVPTLIGGVVGFAVVGGLSIAGVGMADGADEPALKGNTLPIVGAGALGMVIGGVVGNGLAPTTSTPQIGFSTRW